MRLRILFPVALGLLFVACNDTDQSDVDRKPDLSPAESVISKSVDYHFGDRSDSLSFSFTFRGKAYGVDRHNGNFVYTRNYSDSLGQHFGVLSNLGYTEQIEGAMAALSRKDSTARANSLNSVVYFNLIPLLLQDDAVFTKELEGEKIDGVDYHKIEVRFSEDGGGEDHDDIYQYWFDREDYSMDYLAYSFEENDGGTRFRKAINQRRINGLYFQDYENYKGPADPDSLKYISELYKADELPLLSKIEIGSIKVD